MLSAESASGNYPIETVKMMHKIAYSTENEKNYNNIIANQIEETPNTTPDAIATAAKTLADELSSPIIVCYTESGSTGIKVSRVRPSQLILTITPIIQTARKLSLAWGSLCLLQKEEKNLEFLLDYDRTRLFGAKIDISKLSGSNPSAVICEVMNQDGRMSRTKDLIKFSKKHKIKIGSI